MAACGGPTGLATYKLNTINGVPFPTEITKERMDELRDFPLLSDDLFIVSYPKSGTTWMQQIVKLIRANGVEDGQRITHAIPWLEQKKINVQVLPRPRVFKSHTHYEMMPGGDPDKSPAKYIYVARNPKDVAVSLFYHTRRFVSFEFTGDWNCFFEFFINGKAESGSWFDHVLGWWEHKDADNILFIKYEDMKENLRGAVETVSQFMGCHLTADVVESICEQTTFESMKNNDAVNYSWKNAEKAAVAEGSTDFIRKGVVGDWRNHFSEEQSTRLDREYTARMTGTGLDFRF